MNDFPLRKLVQRMKKLFSLFSTSFQANSLLPTLRILVGFYFEEVKNLEDLPLFYFYMTLFTRFIYTLLSVFR